MKDPATYVATAPGRQTPNAVSRATAEAAVAQALADAEKYRTLLTRALRRGVKMTVVPPDTEAA